MAKFSQFLIVCGLLSCLASTAGAVPKDESRLSPEVITAENAAPLPLPAPQPETQPDLTAPDTQLPDASTPGDTTDEDVSLGEIPDVKSMELTADIAKRAIDSYVMVKDKYKDAALEQYDNLQDFVDKNEQGKNFEADIKAAGFANVDDWNLAITTVGFAYTGVTNDQSADIKMQIDEIEKDTTVAQDLKDRMIASLNAMIPSENNRKIVEDLMKDPAYADKLQQLDSEEE